MSAKKATSTLANTKVINNNKTDDAYVLSSVHNAPCLWAQLILTAALIHSYYLCFAVEETEAGEIKQFIKSH